LVFNLETDNLTIFSTGMAKKNIISAVNFPVAQQTSNIVDMTNEVVTYLATVVTKSSASLSLLNSSTIRVLNSTIYAAPSPLPPTDKTQFFIVINTTFIPNNLITSVTQNGAHVDIVIDTAGLGYELTTINGISVVGKFS